MRVVTWISPSGQTISICPDCERKLQERGKWPKDSTGQEYCGASHGLHRGNCEVHEELNRKEDA